MTPTVTSAHLDQYDARGFFVLERVIPPAHLELLRRLADEAVAARMLGGEVGDAEGEQLMDTHGGRYFVFGLEAERPEIYSALFADWAVTIIGAHHTSVLKHGSMHGQDQARADRIFGRVSGVLVGHSLPGNQWSVQCCGGFCRVGASGRR